MSNGKITLSLADYEAMKETIRRQNDLIEEYLKPAKPIVVRDFFGFLSRFTVLNVDQKLIDNNNELEERIQMYHKRIVRYKDIRLPFFGLGRKVSDLIKDGIYD